MNGHEKDPVCGMTVLPQGGPATFYQGRTITFCSDYCRDRFIEKPDRYFAILATPNFSDAKEHRRVAYFSMEVAVSPALPTYSGGLGVLAGDTLKSCADLRVPIVGVTLLYRKGYFEQRLDEHGNQQEWPVRWQPEGLLHPLDETIQVEIERRMVRVRAWQCEIVGLSGYAVPLILLDTNVEGNTDDDRALTDFLYGGDDRYRLAQEAVLGIGGVRMLRALGYSRLEKFHMNEGHASLLVLELLKTQSALQPSEWDYEGVRDRCVFTTHTPVPAGHDRFGYDLVERVLGEIVPLDLLEMLGGKERLNMTLLGFNLSRYVNGVAKRHEEVSREMFPGYAIHHITNGVHSWTWVCDSFKALFDSHIPDWGNDPAMLRKALNIPKAEVWAAHMEAKTRLLALIRERTGREFSTDALTIGFARRATAYKRADLVFSDMQRLLEIARQSGPLQFVFAGKAHPRDFGGKQLIERIIAISRQAQPDIPIVYLEDYDLEMAKQIVSGVDVWLNTPQRPLEASGTSGMKAAHNGVPSLSTLDGWWVEGCVEGLTGWPVGSAGATPQGSPEVNRQDAEDLYRKLQEKIVPLFYRHREQWIEVMRHAIALNASYFNTHRMVQQYVTNAYLS